MRRRRVLGRVMRSAVGVVLAVLFQVRGAGMGKGQEYQAYQAYVVALSDEAFQIERKKQAKEVKRATEVLRKFRERCTKNQAILFPQTFEAHVEYATLRDVLVHCILLHNTCEKEQEVRFNPMTCDSHFSVDVRYRESKRGTLLKYTDAELLNEALSVIQEVRGGLENHIALLAQVKEYSARESKFGTGVSYTSVQLDNRIRLCKESLYDSGRYMVVVKEEVQRRGLRLPRKS